MATPTLMGQVLVPACKWTLALLRRHLTYNSTPAMHPAFGLAAPLQQSQCGDFVISLYRATADSIPVSCHQSFSLWLAAKHLFDPVPGS
jgi:hypothetical protein